MLKWRANERSNRQRPMRRSAQVVFDSQRPAVRCVIWDMSAGGARLAIAAPIADLPHQFTLILSTDGNQRRHCEVVWADSRYVGVKFF